MKLYEIDDAIQNCFDPETGEVDEEQLIALQMERNKKIDSVAAWVLDLTGDARKINDEIERLEKLKTSIENKTKSLKKFLAFALSEQNYNGDMYSVNFRRTKSIKDMSEEDAKKLPVEFQIVKTTVKPDKNKLKAAIGEGWKISGVEVEERVSVTVK